ncbi:uncharacterized protein LOC117180542 [Belonocnema kinseyi]|uniref:uncharacterized protein LOC117180542 n=1 Tax=Belonocnema kinseyi TaxID=2817044 RepID=UPI00143DBD7C|nr:uncharacterized protein LOC117180542 [Belonocnema kinseyi]
MIVTEPCTALWTHSSGRSLLKCTAQLAAYDSLEKIPENNIKTKTLEEARILKKQLTSILEPAGFFLLKWASNDERVFLTDNQPNEDRMIQGDKNPKTLGLLWKSTTDELRYSVNFPKPSNVTKRTILSLVSQIFDPLGIVGPAIVRARIFLQELWKVNVPRLILCNNPVKIELHGFCDASEKAYGASIYVRSMDDQGNVRVNLLCAKSRVAPLKNISLPLLELCGALLLTEYFHKIKGPSYKWKTYVANRSTKIQELTKEGIWNHVSSLDNPADIISRGINPAGLLMSDLWWHGPAWLSRDLDNWPSLQTVDLENVPGMKKNLTSSQVTVTKRDSARPTTDLKTDYLTPIEIESTTRVSNSSKLKSLQPFLDDSGLLRMGGRLRWRLGRVTKLHPGKDNVTRVVSVRVGKSTLQLPVSKLCILPMDTSTTSD